MAAWCSAPSKPVNLVTVAPSSGLRQKYSDLCSCHVAAAAVISSPTPASAHQARWPRLAPGVRRAGARRFGPRRGHRATERFLDFEARVADVAQAALRILLETALEQPSNGRRRLQEAGGSNRARVR